MKSFDPKEKKKLRFETALLIIGGLVGGLLSLIFSSTGGYFLMKREKGVEHEFWLQQQVELNKKSQEDLEEHLKELAAAQSNQIWQIKFIKSEEMTNWMRQQEILNQRQMDELTKSQEQWQEKRTSELTLENSVAQTFWKQQQQILREQKYFEKRIELMADLVSLRSQKDTLLDRREYDWVKMKIGMGYMKPRHFWQSTRGWELVNERYENESEKLGDQLREVDSKLHLILRTIPYYFSDRAKAACDRVFDEWIKSKDLLDDEFTEAVDALVYNPKKIDKQTSAYELLEKQRKKNINASGANAWNDLIEEMNREIADGNQGRQPPFMTSTNFTSGEVKRYGK